MKLGAQLYTIREFTQTPEAIDASLRKIKAMGFDVIQISAFGPMDPQKLADLVHELELDVCCTHSPYDRILHDTDALIKEHQMMGCDTIGLGIMPEQYRGSASDVRKFIAEVKDAAQYIKDAGLQFAYHNHNVEFQKSDGVLPMDILIEETDPETFNFILDTYWLQMGGVNPATYIRKVKDRMKVCHFKDFAVTKWVPTIAAIGEGNIDFAECFRACEDANTQYIVIEQDTCPRDPFDCLAYSYDNLKKIAANH